MLHSHYQRAEIYVATHNDSTYLDMQELFGIGRFLATGNTYDVLSPTTF